MDKFIFDRMALLLNRFEIFINCKMGKLLSFIKTVRHMGALLYRTKRGKTILSQLLLVLYVSLILLSILMIVTFPSPIKPKTSVGMINIIVVLIGCISSPFIYQHIRKRTEVFGTPVDLLVIGFYLANIVSLLFSERIQDFTPIRMVTSAMIAYFSLKVFVPNEKQKATIVHWFGIMTIGIAVLSVMQGFFPGLMNPIAAVYFQGREAYGLTIEQTRGRIAPWGSIILLFPFFYSSLYLRRNKIDRGQLVYSVGGFIVLLLAMTLSNFRWTFLVFLIGTVAFIKILRSLEYVSKQQALHVLMMGFVVLAVGLLGARLFLGYNLIDRFLLTNNTRDVSDTLGRLLLYSQALNVFSSAPITGAGVGNYYSLVGAFQISRYFSIFDQFQVFLVPIASHNEFLTVLAETGVIGFLCFFLLMYISFKKSLLTLFHLASLSEVDKMLAVASFLSLVMFLLYTVFENIYPENIVYVFLLVGVIHMWVAPYKIKSGMGSV